MPFIIIVSEKAKKSIKALKYNQALNKRFKAVSKALNYLSSNPRHPSLNTHEFKGCPGPNGERIFEAYAENNTPGAYRIFWCYGLHKGEIIVLDIVAHL
jgi:hypothetical protein